MQSKEGRSSPLSSYERKVGGEEEGIVVISYQSILRSEGLHCASACIGPCLLGTRIRANAVGRIVLDIRC